MAFSAELSKIEARDPRRENVVLPPDSRLADGDYVGNVYRNVPTDKLSGVPEDPETYIVKLCEQGLDEETARLVAEQNFHLFTDSSPDIQASPDIAPSTADQSVDATNVVASAVQKIRQS